MVELGAGLKAEYGIEVCNVEWGMQIVDCGLQIADCR